MTRARAALTSLLAALAISLSACATAGGGQQRDEAAAGSQIEVRVNNNLTVPTVLTVYMVNDLGTRRILGSVPANGSRTFQYSPTAAAGQYRLQARLTAGSELSSPRFSVVAGETAVWALNSNIVTIER